MSDLKETKSADNLYEGVFNQIKKAILSGKYKTGEALPDEKNLPNSMV